MMSYDPSSLNRNKTLLEAIEEVKKFLIANPCYKVFYANTNYVIGTTTYSKTYIDDPDSMAEYDVVFFDNNYYGKVESVGDSTFTIIGATNFKGDTGTPGTPGTPGADGQDGISITNVSIDASNHLICTLSNGTTIDAGEIPGGSTRIISLASGLSGTLTQDEYDKLVANDFNYVIEMGGTFYHKANLYGGGLDAHYTCVRKVSSVETWASDINIDSSRAWTLSTNVLRTKIQNGQIDSGAATSGQVLTADGTGGAAWQTPSGGFDNYVEINTTSGTFTDDEYAKLGFNDSVIVYDNGSYKTIYKKKIDTSSIIEFESIDASARQNLKLIDVNKGTKAFSSTGISMITSSTFDSGNATSGKVLTANGSGGTSWETAGGGSKYLHKVKITNTADNSYCVIDVISDSSTSITTAQAIIDAITAMGYNSNDKIHNMSSDLYDSSDNIKNICVYIYTYNNTSLYMHACAITSNQFGTYSNLALTTIYASFTDKVIAL